MSVWVRIQLAKLRQSVQQGGPHHGLLPLPHGGDVEGSGRGDGREDMPRRNDRRIELQLLGDPVTGGLHAVDADFEVLVAEPATGLGFLRQVTLVDRQRLTRDAHEVAAVAVAMKLREDLEAVESR